MNKFENFEGVELANDLDEGELVKEGSRMGVKNCGKFWQRRGGEKGGQGL